MPLGFRHIIYTLVAVTAVAAMCAGCADRELELPYGQVPSGLPSVARIRVKTADRTEHSRADVPDSRITSLWIGMFDHGSGKLKSVYFNDSMTDDIAGTQWEEIEVETTSGLTDVVAVANFETRYALTRDADGRTGVTDLRSALLAIEKLDDYYSMAVTFSDDGDVSTDEPLNALLMSGSYSEATLDPSDRHPDHVAPTLSVMAITPGNYKSPGVIHLRRLISHNIFNISFNADNIESFKVENWQLFNIPTSSWLHERRPGDPQVNSGEVWQAGGRSVTDGEHQTVITQEGSTARFEFWLLENRHTGREPGEEYTPANAYTYREKEYKDATGANTGKFVSLCGGPDDDAYANNATYVSFAVTMTMKVDNDGRPLADSGIRTRQVQAMYTVHLGYCEHKDDAIANARDFNCHRNSRYTYNIKVNNVKDLYVEAESDEIMPGVEGSITDITESYIPMDSHYNVMNVYFTDDDLKDFRYYMIAYDENVRRLTFSSESDVPAEGDADFRFFNWVEFRATTGESVLAAYKPYGQSGTCLLSDMRGRKGGWYTMFINEYAYERFDSSGNIYDEDRYNWHWYVDAPDRCVWLNVRGNVSADGESIYHRSKYAIAQRSIQTYYARELMNPALGVEHVNESLGLNVRNNYNTAGSESPNGVGYAAASGRYVVAQYIMGRAASRTSGGTWRDNNYRWTKCVDQTVPLTVNAVNSQGLRRAASTQPLPAYNDVSGFSGTTAYDPDRSGKPKYVNVVSACMNRNRDLDGDGYIDKDEVRWFVPTHVQYVRMILGRQALKTPVMHYEDVDYRLDRDNGNNSRWLMATSNGRTLWAMEGLSTSWWKAWSNEPWNIRCVRYLGTNLGAFTMQSHVDPPYHQLETDKNIVVMDRMDRNAIRSEAYTSSRYPIPPHVINDQRYNRCYAAFEISDQVISLATVTGKQQYWSDYLKSNNPCASLEKSTGKTGWRVPNQKELSIMATLTDASGNHFYSNGGTGASYLVGCSFTYFDRNGDAYKPGMEVGSEDFYTLKIVCGDGNNTQGGENSANGEPPMTVPSGTFGVRCVRDVIL